MAMDLSHSMRGWAGAPATTSFAMTTTRRLPAIATLGSLSRFALVALLLFGYGCSKADEAKKPKDEKMTVGYIDKSGKFAIPPQFDDAGPFIGGLAAISKDGKWGYIDKTGKITIPPQFDEVKTIYKSSDTLTEPLAAIRIDVKDGFGSKIGFIDKTGKIVIPPQFEDAGPFSEGLAPVEYFNGKWGFIDTTGKFAVKPQFGWAKRFSEGLAPVRDTSGRWGYVDTTGKLVIPLQFDRAAPPSDGLALVEVSGKWGYIDKSGKTVIKPQFGEARSFADGLAAVWVGSK